MLKLLAFALISSCALWMLAEGFNTKSSHVVPTGAHAEIKTPFLSKEDLLLRASQPSTRGTTALRAAADGGGEEEAPPAEGVPQSWVSGASVKEDFAEAVAAAAATARALLPPGARPDLVVAHYSSIYANMFPVGQEILPLLQKAVPEAQTILGSSAAGVIGVQPGAAAGRPSETENSFGVTVTLASLPGVAIHPFHLIANDLPIGGDDQDWRDLLGYQVDKEKYDPAAPPVVLSFPAAGFINDLEPYLRGVAYAYPNAAQIGAIASTVSSLSRPTVFVAGGGHAGGGRAKEYGFYGEGVAGVVLHGDLVVRSLVSQGSAPVGDAVYEVERSEGGAIQSISKFAGPNQPSPAFPPLFEVANLKKAADPRTRSLMQRGLLAGLASPMGRSVSEVLAQLEDPRNLSFSVQNVVYADMKTGSVSLPREEIPEGAKLRFYVRDREAAVAELGENLTRFKLMQLQATAAGYSSRVSGALVFPCLDRGKVLFEEENYETRTITDYINAPMGGFFCNGAIGALSADAPASLFGSSTVVTLMRPKSARTPVGTYNTQVAAPEARGADPGADTIVRRKDSLTGRAIKSGIVEYSVVEKLAQPKSKLEAVVWDKEGEVEKMREYLPLKDLMLQVKLYANNPIKQPQDFAETLRAAAATDAPLPVVAECKKSSPNAGTLRYEYSAEAVARSYEAGGAAAVAVHTDLKYFGGTLNDLRAVAEAVDRVPVLASEFILFPYQIYKIKVSGADAIQLISSILPESDLPYFHKIAQAIGMQVVVCVSSPEQMERALKIDNLQMVSIQDRNIIDWSPAGNDRLTKILTEDVKAQLRERGVLVLAEGSATSKADVERYKAAGVDVVVAGTALLQQVDPGKAITDVLGISKKQ